MPARVITIAAPQCATKSTARHYAAGKACHKRARLGVRTPPELADRDRRRSTAHVNSTEPALALATCSVLQSLFPLRRFLITH